MSESIKQNDIFKDDKKEDIEREVMDVDILIVGGGSAGLSCAYHLQSLIEEHNKHVQDSEKIDEPMIVVLEKGSEIGAHSLSGAVLDLKSLEEMEPEYKKKNCPIATTVNKDEAWFFTSSKKMKLPLTPPQFVNKGKAIISLSEFNRWLGNQVEEKGVNIFPGFSAAIPIYEDGRLVGVQTGDRGRDKQGKQKSNFEPGMILKAKLVVFSEGTRGSLFQQVAEKFNLWHGKNHEVFEEGVKEVIQLPKGRIEPGMVVHIMGYPFSKTTGGAFLYSLPNDQITLGVVGYLDTRDPLFDPHRDLQRLKKHPHLKELLDGGEVLAYGGKTLPAGGWYSMPKLYGDHFIVCGDSAGMVDAQKLKGIHLAIKSGVLAAEVALDVLVKKDGSSKVTREYENKVFQSFIKTELYKVRNFHQALSKGFFLGLPLIALQQISGGRGVVDPMFVEKDHQTTEDVLEAWGPKPFEEIENQLPKSDGKLFFDKLGSVFLTGTQHDEDSPNHLYVKDTQICQQECEPRYQSPCTHFCPAQVYEMVESKECQGRYDLKINFTNCIHCKTCDIKCPFDNISWRVPEGGGGPNYQIL